MLSWLVGEWFHNGKPTALGAASGLLADGPDQPLLNRPRQRRPFTAGTKHKESGNSTRNDMFNQTFQAKLVQRLV